MGFSHSWIAVQGATPEQAMEALGMEVSPAPRPYLFCEGVALIEWPNWLLVISDKDDDVFVGPLSRLAAFGSAIACSMNERVMYSEARGYEGGQQVWGVVHDPNEDESLYSLRITGSPPDQLEAIVRAAKAEQDSEGGEDADVDVMFDIPPKLAKSICGFFLGEGDPNTIPYSSLKPIGSPEPTEKRGLLARLFGRG